jgi:DNA-binding NarL/FixJ family response regulator
MNRNYLIVSDSGNQPYWSSMVTLMKAKVGSVQIILDEDFMRIKIKQPFDVIVVDVSNIEDLHTLIPQIHREQPSGRIIVVSSTPTWKQTREVIRLGAANMIRKSSNVDEVIAELRAM